MSWIRFLRQEPVGLSDTPTDIIGYFVFSEKKRNNISMLRDQKVRQAASLNSKPNEIPASPNSNGVRHNRRKRATPCRRGPEFHYD